MVLGENKQVQLAPIFMSTVFTCVILILSNAHPCESVKPQVYFSRCSIKNSLPYDTEPFTFCFAAVYLSLLISHLLRLENEWGKCCHRKQDIKDYVERHQGPETD